MTCRNQKFIDIMSRSHKKRKHELDLDAERTMYTSFAAAANAVSQLYTHSVQQQKQAACRAARSQLVRVCPQRCRFHRPCLPCGTPVTRSWAALSNILLCCRRNAYYAMWCANTPTPTTSPRARSYSSCSKSLRCARLQKAEFDLVKLFVHHYVDALQSRDASCICRHIS